MDLPTPGERRNERRGVGAKHEVTASRSDNEHDAASGRLSVVPSHKSKGIVALMPKTIICAVCGAERVVHPSSPVITCGKACAIEHQKRSGRRSQTEATPFGVPFNKIPQGPCPKCGQFFLSASKKKFCSVACYQSSDEFQKRIREQASAQIAKRREEAGHDGSIRLTKHCRQCSKEFFVAPNRFNTKHYCSTICYRRYFAMRFDRWIASPQSIALPQCFDEFLAQNELPCLIDGCGWIGKQLGNHVNFAHGITADEFKKRAGFNKRTGLISADLSAEYSAIKAAHLKTAMAAGFVPFGGQSGSRDGGQSGSRDGGSGMSLEGREHSAKSRALKKAEWDWSTAPVLACTNCGRDVPQPPFGRQAYCGTKCRSQWYSKQRFSLTCSHCGNGFLGSREQKNRSTKGHVVCCSLECRNARNITLTPNHQKHLERAK